MLIKSSYQKFNLNEIQNEVLNSILNKIETNEYMLVDVPCICGADFNDELVSNSFYPNFINSKINIVICKSCGTVRSTPYFADEAIADFYSNYYRELYNSYNVSVEERFNISYNGGAFEGRSTYGFLKPLVEQFKKNHNKEKLKIFEIGCGYGGNLYHFHQDGEDIYGCDYGEEGLNVAKNKGMKQMFIGDMNVLKPFGIPDVVMINHVLEHIVDLQLFLRDLKELISKDTLVYIGVPSLLGISCFYRNNMYRYFQIAHVWNFSNNTLDALMYQNGFEKVESNEIIQAVYKYTGDATKISLLGEYKKNSIMLQTFDNLYNEQQNLLNSHDDNLHNIHQRLDNIQQQYNKKAKKFKKYIKYTKLLSGIIILLIILVSILLYKQ